MPRSVSRITGIFRRSQRVIPLEEDIDHPGYWHEGPRHGWLLLGVSVIIWSALVSGVFLPDDDQKFTIRESHDLDQDRVTADTLRGSMYTLAA